jgi:hypothetical protein
MVSPRKTATKKKKVTHTSNRPAPTLSGRMLSTKSKSKEGRPTGVGRWGGKKAKAKLRAGRKK